MNKIFHILIFKVDITKCGHPKFATLILMNCVITKRNTIKGEDKNRLVAQELQESHYLFFHIEFQLSR